MLKGKEFGAAVASAIQMKLDSGAARSKAEIARHFSVKPPSVEDWIKKGAIAKEKLPELWRYFSDVAGPEHWGLSEAEWPAGLSDNASGFREPTSVPPSQKLNDEEMRLVNAYRALGNKEKGYLMADAVKYLENKK